MVYIKGRDVRGEQKRNVHRFVCPCSKCLVWFNWRIIQPFNLTFLLEEKKGKCNMEETVKNRNLDKSYAQCSHIPKMFI